MKAHRWKAALYVRRDGGGRREAMVTRLLWRGYRAELWGAEEFGPVFAATGEGWPEKEVLLAGMGNVGNGSLRG